MSPILAMRYLVEDFTDTFDLIGNRLSKSLIRDIFSEYEMIWAEEPDNFNVAFDCESLLNLLGEHEQAQKLLEQITGEYGSGTRVIRYAHHASLLQNQAEMERALQMLLKEPKTVNEKACACIAAGRLGDRNSAIRLWKELMEEEGVISRKVDAMVLSEPDSYTCLSSLEMRERGEILDLLYRYDIRENRDIELYYHATVLHYQLGIIQNSIYDMIKNESPYDAFSGIMVAHAIANGAYQRLVALRDSVIVEEPQVFEELILIIEGARRYRAFYTICERILTVPSPETVPDRVFLETLKQETGGDIYQIYSIADLFRRSGLEPDLSGLLDVIEAEIPNIAQKITERRHMESYLGQQPPYENE